MVTTPLLPKEKLLEVSKKFMNKSLSIWRHDTQHNDTQHNDIQQNNKICSVEHRNITSMLSGVISNWRDTDSCFGQVFNFKLSCLAS